MLILLRIEEAYVQRVALAVQSLPEYGVREAGLSEIAFGVEMSVHDRRYALRRAASEGERGVVDMLDSAPFGGIDGADMILDAYPVSDAGVGYDEELVCS